MVRGLNPTDQLMKLTSGTTIFYLLVLTYIAKVHSSQKLKVALDSISKFFNRWVAYIQMLFKKANKEHYWHGIKRC